MHDGPLCAALGHYVGTVTVIYCPHHQAWTMVFSSGDDADDQAHDHGTVSFGPFDSNEDVARRAQSYVAKLIRVDSRTWLNRRRELGDGSELTDGGF